MEDYGVKISLPGKDITSTEERDYAFWSKLSTLKIVKQGSGTINIPIGTSNVSVDIAHGMSFIPMYLVYSQLLDGSGKWYLNCANEGGADADSGNQAVRNYYTWPPYAEGGLYIDATNLHIEYKTYDNTVAHDIDYYYFIFGERGGPDA